MVLIGIRPPLPIAGLLPALVLEQPQHQPPIQISKGVGRAAVNFCEAVEVVVWLQGLHYVKDVVDVVGRG